jgi:hypothetical protein
MPKARPHSSQFKYLINTSFSIRSWLRRHESACVRDNRETVFFLKTPLLPQDLAEILPKVGNSFKAAPSSL